MKVILSISIVVLVYLSSSFDFLNPVDITGKYRSENTNPKTLTEYLQLKKDQRFEYNSSMIDGTASTYTIAGRYELKGDKLRLFPSHFKNHIPEGISPKLQSETKVRSLRDEVVNSKTYPLAYKKRLAFFESGASRLKPVYYVKQMNGQLSLCLSDIKTEQFSPEFSKK